MKVLFVAEGKHELAIPEHETSPLVELVRQLLPKTATIERYKVSDHRVRIHLQRGQYPNYGKRLEA